MRLGLFIEWLTEASLAGSLLAAAILGLRFLLRRRMSIHWYYGLWLLLMLRLLLPPLPVSFLTGFPGFDFILQSGVSSDRTVFLPEARNYLSDMNELKDYALSVVQDDRLPDFFAVWCLGAFAFSLYLGFANRRTARLLKDRRPVGDAAVLLLFEDCRKEAGVRGPVALMQTDAIKAPALYGLVDPVLLVPVGLLRRRSAGQLRYVFLHELVHYKRKDVAVNFVSCLLQILHWFNPLIAYAFSLMRQDREAACDSRVLSHLKPEEYKEYGLTILSFAGRFSSSRSLAGLASFGAAAGLKRRLIFLTRYRRQSRRMRVLGGVLFLLLGGLSFTKAAVAPRAGEFAGGEEGKIGRTDLASYFSGQRGCFVLFDQTRNEYEVFNERKCGERVPPDSTFKIASALIGLENGAVRDLDEEVPWTGTVYPFAEWNGNQTLRSAMVYSVNWFFEEINRRIGSEKMLSSLRSIGYGNHDVSGGTERFWNESSLKISPFEQVAFLKKFREKSLPFAARNIDLVEKAITLSDADGVVFAGKTGTGEINHRTVRGWFVGYLTDASRAYFFAAHLWGGASATGKEAREITIKILKDKKLLKKAP